MGLIGTSRKNKKKKTIEIHTVFFLKLEWILKVTLQTNFNISEFK